MLNSISIKDHQNHTSLFPINLYIEVNLVSDFLKIFLCLIIKKPTKIHLITTEIRSETVITSLIFSQIRRHLEA